MSLCTHPITFTARSIGLKQAIKMLGMDKAAKRQVGNSLFATVGFGLHWTDAAYLITTRH